MGVGDRAGKLVQLRHHQRVAGPARRERFPQTTQKIGSLQIYAVMRSLSFRRMRVPKPLVELGDKV